jgi:hypothetical protein
VPQLKDLLEISFTITSFRSEGGEKVEAKDGGTQSGDGRNKKSLSTGVQEGERKILAEFIELTGYHRVYARSLLRMASERFSGSSQAR